MDRECELRIPELLPQINAPEQNKAGKPARCSWHQALWLFVRKILQT
jgi:hypothetical protein